VCCLVCVLLWLLYLLSYRMGMSDSTPTPVPNHKAGEAAASKAAVPADSKSPVPAPPSHARHSISIPIPGSPTQHYKLSYLASAAPPASSAAAPVFVVIHGASERQTAEYWSVQFPFFNSLLLPGSTSTSAAAASAKAPLSQWVCVDLLGHGESTPVQRTSLCVALVQ
jgi:hypothetical protein